MWSPAAGFRLLHNPIFQGQAAAFDQRLVPDKANPARRKKRLVKVALGEEGHVSLPAGVVPALVDSDLWRRVQARLTRNRTESERADRDPEVGILPRGHGRCGLCGGGARGQDRESRRRYYICGRVAERGCGSTAIAVDRLGGPARKRIHELLTGPAVIEERLAALASRRSGARRATAKPVLGFW